MLEREEDKTFRDSVKKDVSDLINMRNSPGDTVWSSVINIFSRKRPVRFFDVFITASMFVLVVLFAVVFIRSIYE